MTTYSTGTISVGNGSTTVTGSGTAWTTAGLQPGDAFNAAGLYVPIASIDSATQITLARPWAGSNLSGANYNIWPIPEDQRALSQLNLLLQSLGAGTLTSLGQIAGAANTMPYWTGVGVMGSTALTAAARTLLDDATVADMRSTLELVLTTSATDSTAGRVTKVGDFGLGLSSSMAAPSCTNLDDSTLPSGIYRTSSDIPTTGTWPASAPTGFNQAGVLIVARVDGGSIQQVWLSVGEDSVWRRRFTGGSWGTWRRMTTIQGTVTQAGGVATGAILQGNANASSPTGGYAQRTADGFQTCHHTLTSSASADTTWTYNSAFLSGSTPVVSLQPVGDADYFVRLVSRSATACVFSIRDGSGNRVAVPVDCLARGRWSNMT